ncbi:MAG: ExeM/NucH family extracellular endonuclease [Xanthomonadales bacterium]|nr:ExeM/NucH family extracellular endonuclease [Xanthomonadales bacterium]
MDGRQPPVSLQTIRLDCLNRALPAALSALLLAACSDSPELVCGDPAVAIPAIQGTQAVSPMLDQQVEIEGVATLNLQGSESETGGTFLQMAALASGNPDTDARPDTSEGLLVEGLKLPVGQRYRVRGRVTESGQGRSTVTALEPVAHLDCGSAQLPAPVPVKLPIEGRPIEALEAMRIAVEGPLTVTGSSRMGSSGEIVVSSGKRLFQPTEVAEPGELAVGLSLSNLRRSLVLDDASLERSPAAVAWWDRPGALAAGDLLGGALGVVDHRYGYRLHLEGNVGEVRQQGAPAAPAPAGNLRVVGFNVLNYFNGDGSGGGFPTRRGAATAREFERQEAKIVAAMVALQSEVFALSELENDGSGPDSAVTRLASALARASGRPYRAVSVDEPQPDDDSIAVGIIYDAEAVSAVGPSLHLRDYPFDHYNRPPLAQAFRHDASGQEFSVVVVHFKSKGCGETDSENADQGDGQGCWNRKRVEASRALTQWLMAELDPAAAVVVGDFNAYSREDPLGVMEARGFLRLLDRQTPAYSYVFRGRSGLLDHGFAGGLMARQLALATVWHINADYADLLDYRSSNDPGPVRSSDHDPIVFDFQLD